MADSCPGVAALEAFSRRDLQLAPSVERLIDNDAAVCAASPWLGPNAFEAPACADTESHPGSRGERVSNMLVW